MELKLNRSPKIKVLWDGQEYWLSKPTMAQALDYEKRADKGVDLAGSEGAIEFICSLGLPREVVLQFDADCLQSVVDAIAPTKKKA